MQELWLNFSDPDGVTRRVRVEGERYVIGRQPDCDLAIPDSRLSRQHALIERFGTRYEISDLGSSNGTELRGTSVLDPVPIYGGNVVSLGGFEMRAEIVESIQSPLGKPTPTRAVPLTPEEKPANAKVEKRGGIPMALLLAAPVLAVVLVVVLGGVAYLVLARGSVEVTSNPGDVDDPVSTSKKDDDPPSKQADDPPVSADDNPSITSNSDTPSNSTANSGGPTAGVSETAKVEANGANFMRSVALKDPTAFLTTEQAQRVSAKVKQFSGGTALADNIKAAQKNNGDIARIAKERGLKPRFLAVAAIAKLGNTRGNVVQTAESLSEVLGKLAIHVGTERADDCMLTIAAYDQGAAGETLKMRNMLQDLTTKSPESSRTIRTIWFLQKEGKITSGEFDRAVTFLAIGTITQNPKEFGVNAEALDI